MPGPLDEQIGQRVAPAGDAAVSTVLGPDAENAINRRIFETSLDLILVVDRQGNFIRVSPSVTSILGYAPDELVGTSAKALVYPDDLDNTRSEMRAARHDRVTRNFECRYIHKRGRLVNLWWTGVWSDPEQQYFFIGRDITDRKETEKSRARGSRPPCARGRDQRAGPRERGLARRTGGDQRPVQADLRLCARNRGDRGRNVAGSCPPGDRERVTAGMMTMIQHGGLYRDEFRIRRADTGEERWVRAAAQTVLDSGYRVGVHLDITELKQNAHLLEAALDLARLGTWTSDATPDVSLDARVDMSPQTLRIAGLDPKTFDHRVETFWNMIHPEDRGRLAEARNNAIEHGARYDVELRFTRPDKTVRWVHLRAGIIRDAAGRPTKVVGVMQDITETRSAQEQLRQAQKMEAIGNLTGGMAHDFNNLLGVIIGNLDLLHDSRAIAPEDRELVREALAASSSGADLTRRLLAFARRQPLQPQVVKVNVLVSGIAGLLGRTLGEHIPISLKLGDGIWPVRVDPAQLEASLVNLANNARDVMPDGGRLMIATANRHLDEDYAARQIELLPGDYAMVEVSDTGTGIPPDLLTQIFEPFFTTKEPGKGTGLGLSMVFGFVKQSGGHINVYSEPGAGTTFRLYLPRELDGAEATETAVAASPATAGTGETILIVEDNVPMRRIVRRQLVELGYRVIEAEGAAEALDLLTREPVRLLFSDIVMPGEMNGIALAREALTRWPALQVILTSGFPDIRLGGSNGETVTGLRLLTKPYRRAELAEAIREALGPE